MKLLKIQVLFKTGSGKKKGGKRCCGIIPNLYGHFSLSVLKMLVISAGIHKILVRVANKEDPNQTAEAVWSGSAQFVNSFLAGN